MSLRLCAAYAELLGVWLDRVPKRDDLLGCIISPRGNSGIAQGRGVVYTPKAAWEEVFHELSHVAWWHPRNGVDAIDDEAGMIAYEFHVVRAISGRRRALEYLRTDYVRYTSINAEDPDGDWTAHEVIDLRERGVLWKQSWWISGLKEAVTLGLIDEDNLPTWRRASWGNADYLAQLPTR